jgi:hypothetical protein
MPGRSRRRAGGAHLEADEGPFVSFTDLFIGILFLFLILVAALMLMHQEAIQEAEAEARRMAEQIRLVQAKLDATAKLDASHAPYRLALVYNSYQKPQGAEDWTFSRTVQVFRAPNGLCLTNVILQSNLSLSWKKSVEAKNIPTADNQDFAQMGTPCTLSGAGQRWNSDSETGSLQRISANLYSGFSVLHKKDGDEKLDLQYRILGVYDDYFGKPSVQGGPQARRSDHS